CTRDCSSSHCSSVYSRFDVW
nr:immunoglobulin heavy chain junction region [Macaca mulatta]MOV49088.1 immunoglobulin heavy chain junction region [Macaca mulatta]MOV49514.1 immunoglobulin heavy chain junction region [Macaca mulatta]MOV49539.1 immunoglobulin heavy chain junction region [Macaca mulatta]MOV49622.1 immunoglobulin heavy chain junction region [Macaca mulatta]